VTKKKIVWEPPQLAVVAKRSYLIRNDPLFLGTDVEAVRRAQRDVLPAELHRPLRSMQEVPRVLHLWRKLHEQSYTGHGDEAPPMAQPAKPSRPLEAESTANLLGELAVRLTDALDEERIRKLVREEVNRVLETRASMTVLRHKQSDASSLAGECLAQ
jgi:hypothetical protein